MIRKKQINQKTLDKIVASSANKGLRLHVLPRGDKWVVRKDGSIRASGIYTSKEQAILVASNIVKENNKLYAVVHDRLGNVIQRING